MAIEVVEAAVVVTVIHRKVFLVLSLYTRHSGSDMADATRVGISIDRTPKSCLALCCLQVVDLVKSSRTGVSRLEMIINSAATSMTLAAKYVEAIDDCLLVYRGINETKKARRDSVCTRKRYH